MRVPALFANGLKKTFGARTVLHPFELQIQQGEIRALLGQNGSGKSTLIKILSGFHMPDEQADCFIRGEQLEFGNPGKSARLGLRFVHQDLGLISTSSVVDNIAFTTGFQTRFGTIRGNMERARARRALETVGLDLDPARLVASLTPAERTGLAVARAVYQDEGSAAILVLDEPTAALPPNEVGHLHKMIRSAAQHGLGVVYVSHHLAEVFQLADTVSVLRDGHLVESCNVSNIDHSTLVHTLVGSELEAVTRAHVTVSASKHRNSALSVSELQSDFIHGVSLEATSGEIVGIYGLTGSGRESILGTIFGSVPRQAGEVQIDGITVPPFSPALSISARIGYVPPDRKVNGGVMQFDATENLTLTDLPRFRKRGFLRRNMERLEAERWFELLQISPRDGVSRPLASFSGGNQQKIILAKWLRMNPRVLLLDEPTQGVDVGAKAQIHRVIMEAANDGAIVVLTSTDLEELTTLCGRVLVLRDGKISAELMGDDVDETRINRELVATSSKVGNKFDVETRF